MDGDLNIIIGSVTIIFSKYIQFAENRRKSVTDSGYAYGTQTLISKVRT